MPGGYSRPNEHCYVCELGSLGQQAREVVGEAAVGGEECAVRENCGRAGQ